MAAIMGIVESLVGPAIELGKCIAKPIKRPFDHLWCFNSNIENLENATKKLKVARDGLQMQVDRAKDNTDEILPEVEIWSKGADDVLYEKTRLDDKIANTKNGLLSIKSRSLISEQAAKIVEHIEELLDHRNFYAISQPASSAASAPIFSGLTREFESRKHIVENIVKALREEEEVKMVGICGMGGVGKTTMAESVMKRVKAEELFVETVKVVVGQQADKFKIQEEMAELLGLELKQKSLSSRAHRLHKRLAGGKRILIVIDDVWEYLNLGELLGIPCESGSGGCRILLTSRNQDTLKWMNVQQVYPLNVLKENEAWDLFKSNVGSCIDDQDVAQDVVKECKGLPIALVTLGLALKDKKEIQIWKATLQQLQTSNPKYLPGFLQGVHKPLRISYDSLETKVAKSLFLLCCLFGEDRDIYTPDLTYYIVGLGKLEGNGGLEEARNIIHLLVEMLKNRCLLQEGRYKSYVRMHDVLRDVAIFIDSERSRDDCSDGIWYSSFHKKGIEGSIRQNLDLLMIDNSVEKELQVTDNFFEKMTKVKVLFMRCETLQSLPQTTKLLKSLRTLILDSCESLKNIDIVGEFGNLEILICRCCGSMEELRLEMRNLSRLRLLEIKQCIRLKKIRLTEWEELKMVEKREGEEDKERKNGAGRSSCRATLFPLLESLELSHLPELEEMISCDVRDGPIQDEGSESNMVNLGKDLVLPKLKTLSLNNLPNLTTLGKEIESIEFPHITDVQIRKCPRLKGLVHASTETCRNNQNDSLRLFCKPKKDTIGSLKTLDMEDHRFNSSIMFDHSFNSSTMLWCPQTSIYSFTGLETLRIRSIKGIKSLFSSSLARNLTKLKELDISSCLEMVRVIEDEEEEDDSCQSTTCLFPQLQKLKLKGLQKLEIFYKCRCALELPSLKEVTIQSCPEMERLSLRYNLTTNLETIRWTGSYREPWGAAFQIIFEELEVAESRAGKMSRLLRQPDKKETSAEIRASFLPQSMTT